MAIGAGYRQAESLVSSPSFGRAKKPQRPLELPSLSCRPRNSRGGKKRPFVAEREREREREREGGRMREPFFSGFHRALPDIPRPEASPRPE